MAFKPSDKYTPEPKVTDKKHKKMKKSMPFGKGMKGKGRM
jgi:hypothetical protein